MPINTSRHSRGLLDWFNNDEPVVDRATLLPIGQYDDGSLTFAWPGFLKDAWEGGQRTFLDAARAPVPDAAPGSKWASNVDALNAASVAPMAGVAGRAAGAIPRGALGSGGSDMVTKPKGITAYHGSFNDIEKFKPNEFGTHFGTARQANKMLDIKRAAGHVGDHDGALYPVEIAANSVFDGSDMQHLYPQFLIRDLRDQVPVSKDTVAKVDELVRDGRRQEAFDAVRQAFSDAGYDAYRYRNRVEGDGWSYVPLRHGTVRSATTGEVLFANPDTASLPYLMSPGSEPGGLLGGEPQPELSPLFASLEPFGPQNIPRDMKSLTAPWDARRPDWDLYWENMREPQAPPFQFDPPQKRRWQWDVGLLGP